VAYRRASGESCAEQFAQGRFVECGKGASFVTVVGHSLGGTLALLDGFFASLQLLGMTESGQLWHAPCRQFREFGRQARGVFALMCSLCFCLCVPVPLQGIY
jgi:hypothetical protein